MGPTTTIEELDAKIELLELQANEINQALADARQQRAEILCPFKVGDIIHIDDGTCTGDYRINMIIPKRSLYALDFVAFGFKRLKSGAFSDRRNELWFLKAGTFTIIERAEPTEAAP